MLECDLRVTLLPMACFLHNRYQLNKIATSVDFVGKRACMSALWPPTFGPAGYAIEMLGTPASRFDIAWSGTEVFPLGPWQSDLMIVAGAVPFKLPVLGRICDQMSDTKGTSRWACVAVRASRLTPTPNRMTAP